MKKSFIAKMSVLLASIMLVCVSLTGCGGLFGGGGDNSDSTPKEYTIQYSDDAGTHTLTVTEGMPYSLESVPYKYGYEFLGLYDAQTGGTQYVGANGASLSPYKDKENKVLFPQFKPIDYTVILDYGGAEVTGDRSFTVAYNSNLPELPKNLALAHNEFTGWYTETGGKGTQVADAYGNLPVVSVLNEENFKLDESKRVYLYAGFELETYTVTFIFGDEIPSEEMEVPYNTPISQVVPKTRNSEKQAGLTWSKSKNGEVFNGNVTDDIVLYVQEWAPVIELNGNGVDVMPIVAKAGTTISLPTPTKPLAKFLHWEDENGQEKDISTMPTESMTLNAVWQAKIELDENGGTDVDDISKPAGESISLPTPTKEGYLFAGWYTTDKEQYTAKTMPSAGIALKAGWYKEKSSSKIELTSNESKEISRETYATSYYVEVSLEKWGVTQIPNEMNVKFELHLQANHFGYFSGGLGRVPRLGDLKIGIYNINDYSSSEELGTYVFENNNITQYQPHEIITNLTIKNGVFYIKFRAVTDKNDNKGSVYISDMYYTLTYPDTTYLYL